MPKQSMPLAAARLFGTPLFAHPVKAMVIAQALGPRLLGGSVNLADFAADADARDVMAGQLTDRVRGYYEPHERLFDTVDGVAVIAIEGSLVAKGAWIGQSSGLTSYEGINAQVEDATHDAGIAAVILEVDSFGGEVDGCFECAARIRKLAETKPVLAILTSHACSAGYMLASAANQIVAPQTGIVGSIGVITMHADYSEMLKQDGITVTVLRAGERKADFNPYEPLGENVAQECAAELEELRDMFCDIVARHRGNRLSKDMALATQARTYRGEHAVAAGLADAVADPMEARDAFIAEWGLSRIG